MMGTRLVVVPVLVGASLLIAGAAGARSGTPGRCCFTVAVDAAGVITDDYKGTVSTQWTGEADALWAWSTRFVVAYTGKGVSVLGTEAMAAVGARSAYSYDILLLPDPPATELRRDHRSCPAGWDPQQGISSGRGGLKPAPKGQVITAAQNVGGYARALVVTAPKAISFPCAWLAGFGPGDRVGKVDLLGPDTYAVKAPTADNFLAGKSFGRSCWQKFEANLPNPFPHRLDYETELGIHFTYFPKEQLPQKLKQLASTKGKEPSENSAYGRAIRHPGAKPDFGVQARCE